MTAGYVGSLNGLPLYISGNRMAEGTNKTCYKGLLGNTQVAILSPKLSGNESDKQKITLLAYEICMICILNTYAKMIPYLPFCYGNDGFLLVMELATCDLDRFIRMKFKNPETQEVLSQDKIRKLALNTLQSIAALHECGYVHGDIKPGNLLLFPNNRVKITDFATINPPSNHTIHGTIKYSSPELLPYQEIDASGLFKYVQTPSYLDRRADDVWRTGLTVWCMLTDKPYPKWFLEFKNSEWKGLTKERIKYMLKQLHNPLFITIDSPYERLLTFMLQPHYYHRITAMEAVNHLWNTIAKN